MRDVECAGRSIAVGIARIPHKQVDQTWFDWGLINNPHKVDNLTSKERNSTYENFIP